MKCFIDTEPCESCDFAPAICGRDIEDCMIHPENKCDNADNGYLEMVQTERNEICLEIRKEILK